MPPTRFESVMPEMPVRNLSAAVEFYSDVLGFRLEHLHGDEYAVMRREGARLGLKRSEADIPPGTGRLYAFLSGIDEYFAAVGRTIAAPARVTDPLAVRPYGYKDFTVHDPDGNHLAFGERLS